MWANIYSISEGTVNRSGRKLESLLPGHQYFVPNKGVEIQAAHRHKLYRGALNAIDRMIGDTDLNTQARIRQNNIPHYKKIENIKCGSVSPIQRSSDYCGIFSFSC